jgi:uncharacterized protein
MSLSLYHASVPQLEKMLKNLSRWLDRSVEHAKSKNFDPNVFLGSRLAPNQYSLTKQIQTACDNAKFIAARLSGKEAPSHPDTETTVEELKARIAKVTDYLGTFKPSDFETAASRKIALPWMPNKVLTGTDYLVEFGLPNFYFHITSAYAILRHNGVELGKADFIGSVNFQDA